MVDWETVALIVWDLVAEAVPEIQLDPDKLPETDKVPEEVKDPEPLSDTEPDEDLDIVWLPEVEGDLVIVFDTEFVADLEGEPDVVRDRESVGDMLDDILVEKEEKIVLVIPGLAEKAKEEDILPETLLVIVRDLVMEGEVERVVVTDADKEVDLEIDWELENEGEPLDVLEILEEEVTVKLAERDPELLGLPDSDLLDANVCEAE